jgi:hypothetical protein
VAGAVEAGEEVVGEADVDQLHVVLQRAVAEQHVHRLADFPAGGHRREAEHHRVAVRREFGDAFHLRDDLGAHVVAGHGLERHFNALLERERARAGVDVARGAAQVVDGVEAAHGPL